MDWNSFKTKARTITEEVRAMLISTSWYEELENFREHLSLAMDEKWLKMEEFKNKIPSKFNLEDHYNFNSSLEKIKTLAIQNNWNSIETFDQWANTYFNELALMLKILSLGNMLNKFFDSSHI